MDVFELYVEVNIIDNIINLHANCYFIYLYVFVYKPNFPEISQRQVIFFVKLQCRPDLKSHFLFLFFGHVGEIDAHHDF